MIPGEIITADGEIELNAAGVTVIVREQVETTFPDGAKLVTVHHHIR
jgi:urease gamma subunit